MLSRDTMKLNATFGTLSDKCSGGLVSSFSALTTVLSTHLTQGRSLYLVPSILVGYKYGCLNHAKCFCCLGQVDRQQVIYALSLIMSMTKTKPKD